MLYLEDFVRGLPCGWLNLATTCRKDNVHELIAISEELTERYPLYEGIIRNYRVELEATDFDEHRELLVHYYEKAPASLNRELLFRRNEHGLYSCPFCGNPKKPDTLDHFIPKDQWPEYSIFPNNLVPQCRSCAPIKGENYYCVDAGTAKFIHPIYSDLLQKFRFKITVAFSCETNRPSFSVVLRKLQVTGDGEDQRVIFHIKNLKVKQRIIKFCQDDYRRWQTRLSKRRFDLRGALLQRLNEIPQNDRGRDWKSAFIEGLLNNEDAVDYLHSLRPNAMDQPLVPIVEELELE
ncbi:HNH endonuclease [Corallincola holothuriorum]|uniref:HNH endonuclease n=1 Tax=Corallincola holothuriorum TaxID=2282215 RepID=A0A368N4Q8_9GAMM|nr:HNH endonuclease [Corallincola holothuriorum]RCU45206.1 HNH endonuclease [Corallincola holothuriorum]